MPDDFGNLGVRSCKLSFVRDTFGISCIRYGFAEVRGGLGKCLNMLKILSGRQRSDQYAMYTLSIRCVNVSHVGCRLLLRPLFVHIRPTQLCHSECPTYTYRLSNEWLTNGQRIHSVFRRTSTFTRRPSTL